MSPLGLILTLLALILFLTAARYTFFAVLAVLDPPPRLPSAVATTRFCVLIPAHNEQAGLPATIEAARAFDYPKEKFRILVLADNCTDGTAQVAREAGVEVVERNDQLLTGKGEAVRWVLANHVRNDEALLICDADSRPAADYLRWMDRGLQRGYGAAQGFNGTANPEASGLAALATITGGMKNGLHYRGKTAAGLPAPLMNGLTLAARTWRRHPWRAFSVAEDFETYLHLVEEGVPIRFVPEAKILSIKLGSFRDAASQRERWSGGQSGLARTLALPMLLRALVKRSWVRADAALELLLPGYAPTTALLIFLALAAIALYPNQAHPAAGFSLAGLLLMAGQFAGGLTMIRWNRKTLTAVLLVPFYLVWKLALSVKALFAAPGRWRRASREND